MKRRKLYKGNQRPTKLELAEDRLEKLDSKLIEILEICLKAEKNGVVVNDILEIASIALWRE